MRITDRQRVKIKIAQKQLGISDDDYRARLGAWDAKSCKDLTSAQADELIMDFKRMGWKPRRPKKKKPSGRKPIPGVIYPISTGQRQRIAGLAAQIRWQYEDGFNRWCKKRFGFSEPLTSPQATKVIEALKAMTARARRKP